MQTILPQNRSGLDKARPADWTLFRRSDHEPPIGVLATLDDLQGWTAEVEGLDNAAFGTTPALALWGETGCFIDYPAAKAAASVTLRPAAPLRLPSAFDSLELWVKGDYFDWSLNPPDFSLSVLLRLPNEKGEQPALIDKRIVWPTYSLRILRLPEPLRAATHVTGIRLAGNDPAKGHRFGLDRLCAYQTERKPLTFAPRPRRPLRLAEGQTCGLNTGPGCLPFPTREETILPDNLTPESSTDVRRDGDAFVFQYNGRDAEVSYRWTPSRDPFSVEMALNGETVGRAMQSVLLNSASALPWFDDAHFPGPLARRPLPAEVAASIPDSFQWEGRASLGYADDRLGLTFDYDPVRYGSNAVVHACRYIDSGSDQTIELGFGADWGLAVWINGEMALDRLDGSMCIIAGTLKVPARLRRGRNLLVCRVIEKLHMFVLNVSPLPSAASWDGPWRVFGPVPNKTVQPVRAPSLDFQDAGLSKGVATARFAGGVCGDIEVSMRIWGKSLVVDLAARSGRIAVLDQGTFRGLSEPAVFEAPPMQDNAILRCRAAGRTVYLSHLMDWYRSNASRPTPHCAARGDSARLLGPIFYLPRTDGVINPVFERFFLTCSPRYEEVLPNIPNPPSPWAREAGQYVYQQSWGPIEFEPELAKARRYAAYGMTRIMHLHHEYGWEHKDETGEGVNDGCTLRLDVSPHKGGNAAMKAFLDEEKRLGFRAGLYTNYADYYPLNPVFSRDEISLLSDGSPERAWVHSYFVKPSRAVEYDARFAKGIANAFSPTAAYTDVHTCLAPWRRIDFDARVPGAGTFAPVYYAYGELLLNDQSVYAGPVFSEGFYHWLYAGLVSGNYAQLAHFGRTGHDPMGALDPAFDLLKVHPLEADLGMGVGADPWITCRGKDNLDAGTDRYLCALLAHGHIAYLPGEHGQYDIRLQLRVYHMARAASALCAGIKPDAIDYQDDGGHWLTLSEIHAAPMPPESRLRVRYPGGLTLHCNWGWERTWELQDLRGERIVLPPNGYLFDSPSRILCASDLDGGHRRDRAQTADGWFVDGRGHEAEAGPIRAAGSAALLVDAARPGFYRLIDGGGNNEIRIEAPYVGGAWTAFSPLNEKMEEKPFARHDRGGIVRCVPGAARYEWTS